MLQQALLVAGESGDEGLSRDRAAKRGRLSPVRSAAKLYRLYRRTNLRNGTWGKPGVLVGQPGGGTGGDGLAGLDEAANGPAAPGSYAEAYSHTNIQVEGVDEGDTAKTDGSCLYAIHDKTVCLIETPVDGSLSLTATIEFESEFCPGELYLYGSVLVVVGNLESFPWLSEEPGWQVVATDDAVGAQSARGADLAPVNQPKVAVKVYDVSNRAEPRLVRDFSLSGTLLGTRRSGDFLYVVGVYWPCLADVGVAANELGGRKLRKREILARLIPRVRDQAATDPPGESEDPRLQHVSAPLRQHAYLGVWDGSR